MKLATLPDGTRDGQLFVVSRDLQRAVAADGVALTLQEALDSWATAEPRLHDLAKALEAGSATGTIDFAGVAPMAPIPRAWQWLDGSAFDSHGDLMALVFGMDPAPKDRPLMYQGVSHHFYGARDDIPFRSEADGIDFEGEFGVITDDVPMAASVEACAGHIKLVVQLNDWSLRVLAPVEMKTGFGWVQAKPPCSIAPVAVTPDELGDGWREGRVALPLEVDWNGTGFGRANGRAMAWSFPELVAHAAATRSLCAGTIIGSGTVSNENYREVGSSCIAERRGIEMLDEGAPTTGFMRFGDRVRMETKTPTGAPLFGAIEQRVVAS